MSRTRDGAAERLPDFCRAAMKQDVPRSRKGAGRAKEKEHSGRGEVPLSLL